MNLRLPLGWRERLDQLRREQGRYREDQPVLQIPIPEPRRCPPEPEDEAPEPSCVIVINL